MHIVHNMHCISWMKTSTCSKHSVMALPFPQEEEEKAYKDRLTWPLSRLVREGYTVTGMKATTAGRLFK